jgi:6-phosphofructokinase 1
MAAMAGAAHYVCIPEVPLDLDDLAARLQERRAGAGYSLVVISEGVALAEASTHRRDVDAFGHPKSGGITEAVAELLKERTRRKPRVVILSYTQRGGAPSAFDAVLGVRMGMEAVDLVRQGQFDRMVASRGGEITSVPLEAALAHNRTVPRELYQLAQGYCR